MRYQLNMSGRYISRQGKKIFNDINEIPMYLYEVIEESLEQLEAVNSAKTKIFNCFHITPFPEEMNSVFKLGRVKKVRIDLSEKWDDYEEMPENAIDLAQEKEKTPGLYHGSLKH